MRHFLLAFLFVLGMLTVFVGCTAAGEIVEIADGTYRAEFSDYDSSGYKDFVEITFEDGLVVSITADAVSEADGTLKSQSESVRDAMTTINGTYPEKFYTDLINQYIENPSSDAIDIVAGATFTSNDFVNLIRALEQAIVKGTTDTVVVER